MPCCTATDSGGLSHISPSLLLQQPKSAYFVELHNSSTEEEEQSTEEELVVAVGNAAKVARRVGLQQQQQHEQQRLRTCTKISTTTTAVEAKEEPEIETTTTDVRYRTSGGDMERDTAAYYYVTECGGNRSNDTDNGKDCYTTTTTTAANTSMATSNEKKNEIGTLLDSKASTISATTTTTTTTVAREDDDDDGSAVVDDEDDYVVGNYGEEEDRAYITSGAATLSQSEHIVQQQKQQQQGFNALVSNVGLFLDQTWNWFHYIFVTIIFLNFVHFASRRESVVGEAKSVVGSEINEGANIEEEEEAEKEKNCSSLESEESGNIISRDNCTSVIDENNSALLENSIIISEEITMSPNTCSIQNQEEVEKAEEAIMAVGVNTSEEKAEVATATEAATVTTTTTTKSDEQVEISKEINEQQQQQQITIVLPSTEQVVVVSGDETVSSSDENTSEKHALSGIRRDSVDSYTSSEASGNLGDIETEICDKSSEDGTSSNNGIADDEDSGKLVAQKIISQVESMFSDEHLAKDGFLLKHVRRRSDGFVSLKLVAGLRKVKQISREFPIVLNALKDSSKLEVNSDGTKVRRVEPLTTFLKAVPIKSKEKEKDTKSCSSSNEENQLPNAATIHQNNKSPSKSGNKENSNNENGNKGAGSNNNHPQSRRNSNANNNNNGNNSRRNSNANPHHRKSSNTSTASSNNSSRHNSFSKAQPSQQQHPADLFRNVYMATYSSSGEENQSPQAGRRRGGSLPIAALNRASQNNGAYLSPNSSPPNGTLIIGPNGARPKSNSYCEGTSPTTMSPWLLRRKASASSRLSNGELTFSGIIRQPRGPDGTKGFANGYRAMILEERLQQQPNSAVSA